MKTIKTLIKKYYKQTLIFLVILFLVFMGIKVNAKEATRESNIKIDYTQVGYITVYIEGEINYPGKYSIKANASINDLIKEAKGLKKEAETAYVNLNKILENDERIYIPKKEINLNNQRININIASLEELDNLPGIGTEKASSIILYRTTYEPFNYLEDLLNVPGITNSILLNIKNEIKLS